MKKKHTCTLIYIHGHMCICNQALAELHAIIIKTENKIEEKFRKMKNTFYQRKIKKSVL